MQIELDDFLGLAKAIPVIDVRTPAEFEQGHIVGAHNLPIFSNEERVLVGTCYKQQGREPAILLGYELIGGRWADFIRQALVIAPDKKIGVHCWRGGMRSGAMAWALELYGFEVYVLKGGYKGYRRLTLDTFERTFPFILLGGFTGSAKTGVLHQMQAQGEQVIDLEHLAQHQGSAFGSMNKMKQPSQEQFENELAHHLRACVNDRHIWLEDESVMIGKRVVPKGVWEQMRAAAVIKINVPIVDRLDFLLKEYGSLDKDFLKENTDRIGKRLGPEQTRDAKIAIDEGRMADFIKAVLVYYDKSYRTGLNSRKLEQIFELDCENINTVSNAHAVIGYVNKHALAVPHMAATKTR